MSLPPHIFRLGDRVRLRHGAEAVEAQVILASATGTGLALEFPERLFAGYVERVALAWMGQAYEDLFGRVFLVEPLPPTERPS